MDQKLYDNLSNFLKLFKNRPYHLAKFLIENDSLKEDFCVKIKNSQKIKESMNNNFQFSDISQMNEYFNSFIDHDTNKSLEEIEKELNQKLNDCLENENYEEAILIRDYMFIHNIRRIIF